MQYIQDYNKEFEDHDEDNRKKENEFYKDNKCVEYGINNNYNTLNQNKIFNNSNIINSNNIFSTEFSDNIYQNPNLQLQMNNNIMIQNKGENRYMDEA